MAHLRCDFFSDALALSTSMTVVLPQQTREQIGMTGTAPSGLPPVLYLLHGLSDDDTVWLRRTSIERFVAPLGLAVIMPQVHRSFYTDEAYGGAYWTFLSVELPALVSSFFRVSERREDTFVAGLSMGGYGALKWALREPDRFAAAASMSGALDLAGLDLASREPMMPRRLFGEREITGTEDDLFHLLATTPDPPRLHVCCGTEDPLIRGSRAFATRAAEAGLDVTARFGPGEHEWGYWDARIQDVLTWMLGPSVPSET